MKCIRGRIGRCYNMPMALFRGPQELNFNDYFERRNSKTINGVLNHTSMSKLNEIIHSAPPHGRFSRPLSRPGMIVILGARHTTQDPAACPETHALRESKAPQLRERHSSLGVANAP